MDETIPQLEQPEGPQLPPEIHEPILGLEVHIVDFLSNYSILGILEGFTPGEVTVSLGEPVSEQRAVTVRFNSFVFEGEILYCRPKQNRYEAHITIDDVEESGLRRVPRFPVKLAAQMFPANTDPVAITIVDISGDGLGVELPLPVDCGQAIAIESGPVFVFATVRYCRQVSNGLFRAGVDIQHLFEKSAEVTVDPPPVGVLGKFFGRRLAATFR
jgi:hypothetical protein